MRRALSLIILSLLATTSAARAQDAPGCAVPGERGVTAARQAAICMPYDGPACIGCEPGFFHRCTIDGWLPLLDRPCRSEDADADAGPGGVGRTGGEGAYDRASRTLALRDRWPGSAAERRPVPQGTVPFHHCRYFDADGVELRVADAEADRARALGLIAWQRCDVVYCRLYGPDGRALHYAPDDQDIVRRDIASGHVSVRASECRAAGRTAAASEALPSVRGR